MIRINLLPIKQDRRREAARNQLLLGGLVVVVEVVIFAFMYFDLSSDIVTQKNVNGVIEAEVKHIRAQIQDHQQILQEIAEFEKRQAAIDGLQDARTGPVHVMLEMSNLLSSKGRPNIDNVKYRELIRLDPTAGYDEDWDYRRLWVSSFSEKKREVVIQGQAMTHEDVAEFLRRINLSRFFVTSELVSTDLGKMKLSMPGVKFDRTDPVVHFTVNATVRYR